MRSSFAAPVPASRAPSRHDLGANPSRLAATKVLAGRPLAGRFGYDDERMEQATVREAVSIDAREEAPVPGVALVFSVDRARRMAFPLVDGEIVLGRRDELAVLVEDGLMSRRHVRLRFDGMVWTIEDLGSTNGTYVDGERLEGARTHVAPRVVRTGRSIVLPRADIRPFLERPVEVDRGIVIGPSLASAYGEIRRAAASGDTLLVTGESGTGKELAARVFHDSGTRPKGPFVAVNCAAIPEGLAERLLFGAKRGAYSGSTHDTEGYVQAAHGGTLFLDEIAELDPLVQAKLLRTIETREVLELGATGARRVDVRVVAATHDLRMRVSVGKFREDLYYRIGRPEVRLAPLRERLEEIPWLVAEIVAKLGRGDLGVEASLVEACALRPWPGNVRELASEIRRAALRTIDDRRPSIEARDLDSLAGADIQRERASQPTPAKPMPSTPLPDDPYAVALREENGNVSRAAAKLGVHRNKVRRWLERYGLERSAFGNDDASIDE